MKQVIFSHGKESGPYGSKIMMMIDIAKSLGYNTLSIDYSTCNAVEDRVELLRESISKLIPYDQLILVGSSMGGYVATTVANAVQIDGLFLLCPAVGIPGYDIQNHSIQCDNVELIHGYQDEIIPFHNSITFAEKHQATLHLIPGNHRLSESKADIARYFELFLSRFE